MPVIRYEYGSDRERCVLELVGVEGTGGHPYTFGDGAGVRQVDLPGFFIMTVSVTQALWSHVMGHNSAGVEGANLPMRNVSWNHITSPGGFLDVLNAGPILRDVHKQILHPDHTRFRLPSETEWEYAARGGPHWADNYRYSGSHEIDPVAWWMGNSGDSVHEVTKKAPNQLGIYDMCGNVWEWCQDTFTRDVNLIPPDGSPHTGPGNDRVLRGGCFHNWAEHCTVFKRYEIGAGFHDGCIGFRLVLDVN